MQTTEEKYVLRLHAKVLYPRKPFPFAVHFLISKQFIKVRYAACIRKKLGVAVWNYECLPSSSLFASVFWRKFVHGVIDGLCEKAGVRYDQYATQLTLSEYTKLKAATAKAVREESREGIDQQKVSFSSVRVLLCVLPFYVLHVSLTNCQIICLRSFLRVLKL